MAVKSFIVQVPFFKICENVQSLPTSTSAYDKYDKACNQVFNFLSGCLCAVHLPCCHVKLHYLTLKLSPNNF